MSGLDATQSLEYLRCSGTAVRATERERERKREKEREEGREGEPRGRENLEGERISFSAEPMGHAASLNENFHKVKGTKYEALIDLTAGEKSQCIVEQQSQNPQLRSVDTSIDLHACM